MNQATLRLVIFSCWVGGLVLALASLQLGPGLRHDNAVVESQLAPFVPQVIGLFVPALSCLAGFWFPPAERAKSREKKLDSQRGIAAIVLTISYLLIVILVIVRPILRSYPDTLEPVNGERLTDFMADALKIAALLSPLALAPLHFLTSSKSK